MKYNYESQQKALDYLIENEPHDMEKFKSLYNVEIEGTHKASIRLKDIVFSEVWDAEEKVQLIKLYEQEKSSKFTFKSFDRDIGYGIGIEGSPIIDQCIIRKNYTGVQALLSLGAHISVATIARIIYYIDDPNERYKFCELIVNHYKEMENIEAYTGTGNQCYLTTIPTLCDRYPVYYHPHFNVCELWRTYSSMEDICLTNDLDLIKLFLPTVKNINPLLKYAVESGNVEMVKLFIENGADVNFQDLEFMSDNGMSLFKTPLKIAIDNNDIEMVKFLHENGADLDFVDKSEKIQEYIATLGKNQEEKETHQYADDWERRAYLAWAETPLKYAVSAEPKSFVYEKSHTEIANQLSNRVAIVKYLYENGNSFSNGQLSYTDLICFLIKFDDFESVEYYFEEARKNNAKLDFAKIISFIHEPGTMKVNYTIFSYKSFEEKAKIWLRLCEKYSKILDAENYNKNVALLLEKIFKIFIYNDYRFNEYKDIVEDFSKKIPEEMLKKIPAVFEVPFNKLEETLKLGYDINCIDEKGNSIIMHYLKKGDYSIDIIEYLISLGANINYNNGKNALCYAMQILPKYDFGTFIRNFNLVTGQLYKEPKEYEKSKKALVKKIIDLSNDEVVKSDVVKASTCSEIKPGYPQIIYNEILKELSKRGFEVDDSYFTESIEFLGESYSDEYVTNPWGYLWNLYSNFTNNSIGTNCEFPNIEKAKQYKYNTEENKNLFKLISEHIKRNFAVSPEQVQEPNMQSSRSYWNSLSKHFEDLTSLQVAQNDLLSEISRYIGNLDYRQIMKLINDCPIIDNEAIVRNQILVAAINAGDMNLCKELVKKGISLVCYDEDGHDVTSTIYSADQINIFRSLNDKYNPDKECEDLLSKIGCGDKVLSKKKKNNN